LLRCLRRHRLLVGGIVGHHRNDLGHLDPARISGLARHVATVVGLRCGGGEIPFGGGVVVGELRPLLDGALVEAG